MSNDPAPAKPVKPAPKPVVIDNTPGPIPFTVDEAARFKDTVEPPGAAPTTIYDCLKRGGHGGPKGDRWYYQGGHKNDKRAELFDELRICEICGMVGI